MRLTIIADDKRVGIDDEFFEPVDISLLDPSIHAVQWYGNHGEIEYKTRLEKGVLVKPANTVFTDVAPYSFAISAWADAKKAAALAAAIPVTEL